MGTLRISKVGVVAIDGHLPGLLKGPHPFPNGYYGETGFSIVVAQSILEGDGINSQHTR